jgi:hypothetical protein
MGGGCFSSVHDALTTDFSFTVHSVHDDDYDRPQTNIYAKPESIGKVIGIKVNGAKGHYANRYDRPRSVNVHMGAEADLDGARQSLPDGYDRPRSVNFQVSGDDSGNSSAGSATTVESKVNDMQAVASFLGVQPPLETPTLKIGGQEASNPPVYAQVRKDRPTA